MSGVTKYDDIGSGKVYDAEFFKGRNAATRYAAEKVLAIVADLIPEVRSAVDVGCGVGTWLSVLRERGVDDICGFDGNWVDHSLLEIPVASFRETNLQQPVECDRRFDLAISLEVAEHVPENCADTFVDSLTALADFVLFSAAIPDQGGVNHLNEQWQSYWAEKFQCRSYIATDPVRSQIRADKQISIPYRQNILLYVNETRKHEVRADVCEAASLSVAHPELYEIRNSKSVKQALRDLRTTASAKLRRMFGRK